MAVSNQEAASVNCELTMSSNNFSGITLLLRERRSDGEHVVLVSYCRPCTSSVAAVRIARELGEELETYGVVPTTYVGLADVFAVSGPSARGAVMARSAVLEWKAAKDVRSAREDSDAATLEQEADEGMKKYAVELGYLERFYERGSQGLAVTTIVEAMSIEEARTLAKKIAIKDEFRATAISLASEPNAAGRLEFVCVIQVSRAADDVFEGGSFREFSRCLEPDEDEDWISGELLHKDDLLEYFNA